MAAISRGSFYFNAIAAAPSKRTLRRRIPLLYLSNKGRYFGRLQTTGQAKLNYLTQQVYKSQDPEFICPGRQHHYWKTA